MKKKIQCQVAIKKQHKQEVKFVNLCKKVKAMSIKDKNKENQPKNMNNTKQRTVSNDGKKKHFKNISNLQTKSKNYQQKNPVNFIQPQERKVLNEIDINSGLQKVNFTSRQSFKKQSKQFCLILNQCYFQQTHDKSQLFLVQNSKDMGDIVCCRYCAQKLSKNNETNLKMTSIRQILNQNKGYNYEKLQVQLKSLKYKQKNLNQLLKMNKKQLQINSSKISNYYNKLIEIINEVKYEVEKQIFEAFNLNKTNMESLQQQIKSQISKIEQEINYQNEICKQLPKIKENKNDIQKQRLKNIFDIQKLQDLIQKTNKAELVRTFITIQQNFSQNFENIFRKKFNLLIVKALKNQKNSSQQENQTQNEYKESQNQSEDSQKLFCISMGSNLSQNVRKKVKDVSNRSNEYKNKIVEDKLFSSKSQISQQSHKIQQNQKSLSNQNTLPCTKRQIQNMLLPKIQIQKKFKTQEGVNENTCTQDNINLFCDQQLNLSLQTDNSCKKSLKKPFKKAKEYLIIESGNQLLNQSPILNRLSLSGRQNNNLQISFQMEDNVIIVDNPIIQCTEQDQNLDIISPAFKVI